MKASLHVGIGMAMAAIASGATGQEQIVTDPTRPPSLLAVEAPPSQGAAPANQLQSVMISPTRRSAIINGVVVELGGKYGGAVLTKVAEDEVVLGSGASRQVLKLHPAVDKVDVVRAEPVAPAAAKSAPRKAKPKAKQKTKAKAKAKAKADPKSQSGRGANAAGRDAGTR